MTKMKKKDYDLIAEALGYAKRLNDVIRFSELERKAYLAGVEQARFSISCSLEKADPRFDEEKFKIASSGV